MNILKMVQEFISPQNLIAILGGAAVLWRLADDIIFRFMARYKPEELLLKQIKQIDDKIIDPFKKRAPKTGNALEIRLVSALDKAKKIILDQD